MEIERVTGADLLALTDFQDANLHFTLRIYFL